MASVNSHNLQEIFLRSIREDHVPVTVFLVNGVKLQGVITWFDKFCLLLKRDQHVQLVYKHAISTVMPSIPVSLDIGETGREAEVIQADFLADSS